MKKEMKANLAVLQQQKSAISITTVSIMQLFATLSITFLSATMLSVTVFIVVLSVVLLNGFRLSVVAPQKNERKKMKLNYEILKQQKWFS